MDDQTRRANGHADFIEKMAKACEQERANMTPARQRKNPFTSPESVANMRAHAARIRTNQGG